MAQGDSVAPKERINIRYRPATGDAKEERELPLRLVLIGDFTQRANETQLEDRSRIEIDKESFSRVMKAQNPKLSISVPNHLDDGADTMDVELSFESLNDFEPDAIARNVGKLKKLIELREALVALKGPLSNSQAFRRKLDKLLTDPEARQRLLDEIGIDDA